MTNYRLPLALLSLTLFAACAVSQPPDGGPGGGKADDLCGNGSIDNAEQCDDGNTVSGDGCNSSCSTERPSTCGDGNVEGNEGCDDGNTAGGDGCDANCQPERGVCGDGLVNAGEKCDDGNLNTGDGCDATCQLEGAVCGDDRTDPGEECDDGNTTSGDGCSATCTIEPGAIDPCGNGSVDMGEQCDDGNTTSGDGCSATCTVEATGVCSPAHTITCTTGDTWMTTHPGSTDTVDSYAGSSWNESGREYAYYFSAPRTGTYTFNLDPATGVDLDLFVVPHSSSGIACHGDSAITYGDSSATFNGTAGQMYYIVVDGYNGAEGSYSLSVDCGVCGDGVTDADEECDDGNTTSGDGCSSTCTNEAAATAMCTHGYTLSCGSTDSWSTTFTGNTDAVDDYESASGAAVGFDASGKEYAYHFVSTVSQSVTVAITPQDGVDLDLYVLNDPDNPFEEGVTNDSCSADTAVSGGTDSVTFTADSDESYSLVVDGFLGAEGTYDISVTCN